MTTFALRPSAPGRRVGAKTIVIAGVAAGVVDALYFSTMALAKGTSPVGTLKAIASFWLDQGAAGPGLVPPLLGLGTHFGLAVVMAAVFALLRPYVPVLRARPAMSGPLYGLLLYLVMYLVVMPLRWPQLFPRFEGLMSVGDILVHLLFGYVVARIIWWRHPVD